LSGKKSFGKESRDYSFPLLRRIGWTSALLGLLLSTSCKAPAIAAGETSRDSRTVTNTLGATTYTAPTDRSVRREPALPALGPAGTVLTDPTFGMRIVRVTDANTMPDQPGRSYQTASGAHTKMFNANDSRVIVTSSGNRLLAFDFDPVNMTVKRIGHRRQPSGGDLIPLVGDGTFFSFTNPDIIYGIRAATNHLAKYDFATKQVTTIFDPKTVDPHVGFRGDITISRDDNELLWFGGGNVQDKDYLVVVYYQHTGKWRALNTQTSLVSGTTGLTGTIDRPMGCPIHNARMSLDGNYAVLVPAGESCGGVLWIWNIPTLHVETVTVDSGGHWAPGYRRMVNHCQLKDGQRWCIRDFADLNPASGTKKIPETILTPAEWANDNHPSWLNDVPGVDAPICLANYRADGSPIRRAWDNEVICVATDGSDRVWRFAHTRTSGTSWVNLPRGNVSQDGRFYMFNSNWEGTLGKRRADVFIVELK